MKDKKGESQSKKGSKGNFFKSVVNGVGFGLGLIIILLGFFIIAYAGWHPASQIISGVFKGNYTFAGNVKFNKQLQLPNVANVTCNSNTSGIIAYQSETGNIYLCVNSSWKILKQVPTYIVSIYNPNTENLTNFQVEVDISQVINNVGTNFEVELSNGSKVNYCFVQQNGECKANYDNVNKIWVKVPLLPAGSTVNLTVISSKANNALNGDKVFDFYDDFDEGVINTSKWNATPVNSYISNGILHVEGSSSSSVGFYSKKNFLGEKVLLVSKFNSTTSDKFSGLPIILLDSNHDACDGVSPYYPNGLQISLPNDYGNTHSYPVITPHSFCANDAGTYDTNLSYTLGSWMNITVYYNLSLALNSALNNPQQVVWLSNDFGKTKYYPKTEAIAYYLNTDTGKIYMSAFINKIILLVDWVYVRKYSPLPVSVNVIQK